MDIMEDLMVDFGEMVDEQFPQQQKTRERIKSTNEQSYEGKTMHKSKYQQNRRQTEGNLSFGDVRIGDPNSGNSKSKIERSKSLKATSVSNLLRLLKFKSGNILATIFTFTITLDMVSLGRLNS